MSPLGAFVDIAPDVNLTPPNLSFFAYGTASNRVDRIVVKLNMNESQELEKMQSSLIGAVNQLLSRDGIGLSDEMLIRIRSSASISASAGGDSSKRLLHRETLEHFELELHQEASTYTALAVHILRSGATVGR